MTSRKPRGWRPLRTLVAGLLAALPLLATLWLLSFALGFLVDWMGPDSAMGHALGAFGLAVSGQEWTGYIFGAALAIALLFLLGVLVERGLADWLVSLIEAVVSRIPVVRTIYETVEKFVEIFSQNKDSKFKSMRPVWCQFGEKGAVSVLGLLSSPEPLVVNGRRCYAVIVPTAPVPIGGGLFFMPVDQVQPANVGMEAVTSIYVSMGVTAAQFLPTQSPDAVTKT
jgi:uncharacterized membrane protein